jgi:glutathione S-transferase
MLTLHDYLPSQNGYKVRLLLSHLERPYRSKLISIFEGEGKSPAFQALNPVGAVPVLELEDGCTLAESNAILFYLAEGTPYLPLGPWQRAQVLRWMFFEEDYVQNGLASLRHWTMTGKLTRRTPEVIAAKRAGSLKTLGILEQRLAEHPFLTDSGYTVADISMFAYVSRAAEAEVSLEPYSGVRAWIARIRAQAGFLDEVHPYSIDPHSSGELH